MKEGVQDLNALAGLFNDLVGKPKRTILIGYSLGAIIGLKAAEAAPRYDGVIAACSVSAGSPRAMDLVGALSLAYSTLFGWPESWGAWHDLRDDLNFNRDVLPVLYAQVMDPTSIGKFEFMRVMLDLPLEGFYQNPGWLFLGMFMATEVRAEVETRAKGPVAQNVDHRYMLRDDHRAYLAALGYTKEQLDYLLGLLNSQTTVTVANQQRQYLRNYFDPQ